jgi:hypothetical protein
MPQPNLSKWRAPRVREIPKQRRWLHRTPLNGKLSGAATVSKAAGNEATARAYPEHGHAQAEIGRELVLHYAIVSRIIKAGEGGKL